jgi:hypothetical protein
LSVNDAAFIRTEGGTSCRAWRLITVPNKDFANDGPNTWR